MTKKANCCIVQEDNGVGFEICFIFGAKKSQGRTAESYLLGKLSNIIIKLTNESIRPNRKNRNDQIIFIQIGKRNLIHNRLAMKTKNENIQP